MKTKMIKILSTILSVCLVISILPMTAIAANVIPLKEETKIQSGKTYSISDADGLKALSKITNEDGEDCDGAGFILTDDIVLNSGTFSLGENDEPLYNGQPIDETNMPEILRP